MTPRPDVVTLETDWDRSRILAAAREAGYNRYPVMSAGREQPIGFFHLKDLLRLPTEARPLNQNLRSLIFVPESKDAASLLTEMRTGGTHLAAVVDEHGDFTGIVSLADCLQALIGPVGDVGTAGGDVVQIGARRWVLSGRLDLRAVRENIGLELPPSRNYVTIAGFVMASLGRIPAAGDRVSYGGWRLTVLEMDDHSLSRLLVVAPGHGAGGAP
jgi:CBS domain containing-hemolysin-like protein